MRFRRSVPGVILTMAVAAGWGPPQKAEKPSDLALKGKGLTKAGTAYTIEAEKPVLAKMKEARTTYAAFAAMSGQQAVHQELGMRATQLEEQRAELQSQLDDLNQRISDSGGMDHQGPPGGGGGPGGGGPGGMMSRSVSSPLTMERDQLKAILAGVTSEQKTVRNQSPQAKDTAALEARIKKADEAVQTALADLRKQVDQVLKQYADLEADPAVKAALAEAKKGNARLHLGPSDSFNAGVKDLAKSEKQILGKWTTAATAKKKARSKK